MTKITCSGIQHEMQYGNFVVWWLSSSDIPKVRFDEARAWVITAAERILGKQLSDSAIDSADLNLYLAHGYLFEE